MRWSVTWIVCLNRVIGRCRLPAAGTASATPIRGVAGAPPAKATAGKAIARTKTGMKYVRFVSKRGTVPVFAATERDRSHIAHTLCVDRHTFRHEPTLGEILLHFIVQAISAATYAMMRP